MKKERVIILIVNVLQIIMKQKRMIRNVVKCGIRFDYLLVDSWFTSEKILRFVKSRKSKCHFLGMIKLGKTKYTYKVKECMAKQLIDRNKKSKRGKHGCCVFIPE